MNQQENLNLLFIFYDARDKSGKNIFIKEYLKLIEELENEIVNHPDYNKSCARAVASDLCQPYSSVINYFVDDDPDYRYDKELPGQLPETKNNRSQDSASESHQGRCAYSA